jgi:hypothetical protein
MAAIDTFEWFVQQFYPHPDPAAQEFIRRERQYLIDIRTENERLRYIDELLQRVRESRKPTV